MKFKKLSVFAITAIMGLSSISYSVHAKGTKANELPTSTQFATKDELKKFNTDDNDGEVNAAKVYFGKSADGGSQQWWIAGSQNGNLTLFAANSLTAGIQFNPDKNEKVYNDQTVYSNHYGASPLRTTLQGLESSHFTSKEQALMNTTTVYTHDTKNKVTYSTTDKLYLGYGDYNSKYITVGPNSAGNLSDGLHIDMDYWGNSNSFWLRTPGINSSPDASHATRLPQGVKSFYVTYQYALRPAFELNLSSVLFGSTVPFATADEKLSLKDVFTLRHRPQTSIGRAKLSGSRQSVSVTGITNDSTYLVVQSKDGAWSKKVSNNDLVFASEMNDTLSSFENCRVWLETTDSHERITYAEYVTETSEKNFKLNVGNNMTVTNGNKVQTDVNGPISDITVKAEDGYMFPADYTVKEQNGVIVTRNSEKQLTISGTPTSDVYLILPPATKKVYSMTLNGNGTFGTVCDGYNPITEKEITITNKGNVDLENVNVSITGKDADKFELVKNSTTTIQPNGTIKVTVKPKDSLAVNTYQATLSVLADNHNEITTDLQFTVSEHDYDKVITSPTCTTDGYTTYTCKNCFHRYVGDEVKAYGHAFGDWIIIDAPTCEQSGNRKHICNRCGFEETEKLNSNGHDWETNYTVDKEPTCIQDGSKSIHCQNCDAVKDSEVITKLGHSFTKYVSDDNATCTQDGTKTAKCDRCDETDTIRDNGTMLEHEYVWKYNDDATCEKNGTETGTCKHCQTKMTREKADSALGHEFKNYVSDDNATCTENGTETSKCERCDKTDTRTKENSTLGHKLTEWKVIKEATTTTTGTKERTCERCDYKESQVIPMKEKDNDDVETSDNTYVGVYMSLFVMSGLSILAYVMYKKREL